jgi:hypothetical protein
VLSELTLYRFQDKSGMTEKQIELQNLKYQTMDVIDKLSIFELFINGNLEASRLKLYNKITQFLNNGAFLNDANDKLHKYDMIVTLLIKIKLYNLLTLISNLRLDNDAINNAIDDILKQSPDVNKIIGELFVQTKQNSKQNTNIIGKIYSIFKSIKQIGSIDDIKRIVSGGQQTEQTALKRELAFIVSGPIFTKIIEYLKQYVISPNEQEYENVKAIVSSYSKLISKHAELFKNINRNFNILNSDCLNIATVNDLLNFDNDFTIWADKPKNMSDGEEFFTVYDDNTFMQFNKNCQESSPLKLYSRNIIIPLMKVFVSIETRLKFNREFRSASGKGSINPNATQFYNQLKTLNYDAIIDNFIGQSFHVSTSYDNDVLIQNNNITGEQIVEKLTNILTIKETDNETWYDKVFEQLNNYYNTTIVPSLNENIKSFKPIMTGGTDENGIVDESAIDVEIIEDEQSDAETDIDTVSDIVIDNEIDYTYLDGWDEGLEDEQSETLKIINEETDMLMQNSVQLGGGSKSKQGVERYAKYLEPDEIENIELLDIEETIVDNEDKDVIYAELGSLLRYISTISAEFVESYITDMIHERSQDQINIEPDDANVKNIPTMQEIIGSLTNAYINNPDVKDTIDANLETIREIWMKGLYDIHGYKYKNHPVDSVEFYLSYILSMDYSDTTKNTFKLNNSIIGDFKDLFKTYLDGISRAIQQRQTYGKRNLGSNEIKTEYYVVEANDIATNYFSIDIPSPILTILILTLIDNYMQTTPDNEDYEKHGYFYMSILQNISRGSLNFTSSFFDTEHEWKRLPEYILLLSRIVFSKNEIQLKRTIKEMIRLSNGTTSKSSTSPGSLTTSEEPVEEIMNVEQNEENVEMEDDEEEQIKRQRIQGGTTKLRNKITRRKKSHNTKTKRNKNNIM